jgi:hypothetical protein
MARDALEQPDDPAMTPHGTAAVSITAGAGPMSAGVAESRHAGEDRVYRRMGFGDVVAGEVIAEGHRRSTHATWSRRRTTVEKPTPATP